MHRQIAGRLTGRVTKWIVFAAWIVVFVVASGFAAKLTDVQNNEASSWLPASAESTKVLDEKNPNAALRSKPLLGQQVIRDFKQAAPGRWTGGKIYDPKTGKTYDSKMTANANGSLKVEGCVLMICQAQTWTRD